LIDSSACWLETHLDFGFFFAFSFSNEETGLRQTNHCHHLSAFFSFRMQSTDPRRPVRQDTYDLRDQTDDPSRVQSHADSANYGAEDEEHSILEDDSDGEERDVDYMDDEDDGSSSLSIPNESIDFDLVYSLHSFAATVEGQANVVKGDSLFLMDDSNSYWWLVRVLKTQEVGYIPAENIETPFERLARLNKHRNVDVSLQLYFFSFLYVWFIARFIACICYPSRNARGRARFTRASSE
jgi:hypothetical protein